MYYRTHNCGALGAADIGKEVKLSGWVATLRNLGFMAFIDLRDRYGITQLYASSETSQAIYDTITKLSRESVISVTGVVRAREKSNHKMATGGIEVEITDIKTLSYASELPFLPNHNIDAREDLKLRYRYLNLRDYKLQQNLEIRHSVALLTRNYLSKLGFYEIETPFLIKSTPEGARDFLVPSRLDKGKFYALPQSPQMFKQLLMVSGFDKYFQIVRCFRDEDFRADRQPEFTQIDCEMSFITQQDIMELFESYIRHVFKKIKNIDLPKFKILTYDESIKTYGSDKPDLRFGLPIVDVTDEIDRSKFELFKQSDQLLAICAKNDTGFTRKQLDNLKEYMQSQQVNSKGFVVCTLQNDNTLKTALTKHYSDSELIKIIDKVKASAGSTIFIIYGEKKKSLFEQAGALRLELAKILGLIKEDRYEPIWVIDFPLLEQGAHGSGFKPMHHPFTAPKLDDIHLLDVNPLEVRADAYDMVINGMEVGGGSIRIIDNNLQHKIFDILGLTKEEIQKEFGFLLNAFKCGVPPHGGIAFGFDRLLSILTNEKSIRDTIAFPKNNSGVDLMLNAPSEVSYEQLRDLGIQVV